MGSGLSGGSFSGIGVNRNQLVVATLNYCGIMHSPFEFYVEQFRQELQEISDIFEKTALLYNVPDFDKRNPPEANKFKWLGGKLDHWFRPHRYSPMFESKVGIHRKDRTFMNKAEFMEKWDEEFDRSLDLKFNQQKKPFTQEEREALRLYDFIMYHTLLSWVYKTSDFEGAIRHDIKKYVYKMREFFNLSFLDEKKKVSKLLDNFEKLHTDVFFFQEFSDLLKERLERTGEYWIETDHPSKGRPDTMIAARKRKFCNESEPKDTREELKHMSQPVRDTFDKFPKTSFMFVGDFVFVGVHLSSSAEKNAKEVDMLLQTLPELARCYPKRHIVCGGDVNSYFGPDRNPDFSRQFAMYPQLEEEHTTIKQRTKTQAQWKKAQVKVSESKDKIMSTLRIKSQGNKIVLINGEESHSKQILPSDNHPFDHFTVVATLEVPR